MNSDRRKSIIALSITLIIGVLLGLLTPGIFHKLRERGERGNRGPHYTTAHKKNGLMGTLNRILEPDSMQVKQIKPITDWAAIRMDSIELAANRQMSELLDSVTVQLHPILTDAQRKRLGEFNSRAKTHWERGDRERQRRN